MRFPNQLYKNSEFFVPFLEDDEFNKQTNYAQNFLRWRDREGIELPDVFVMRNNKNGEYMPMDISKLRKYAKMFSVFLGKEFIIC